MLPLPAITFSSKVIVGEASTATPVAPDAGVNDERVGDVVSMVMVNTLDAPEMLPAASACVAEMLQSPVARVPSVQVPPEVLPVMAQVTLLDPVLVAVTVTVPPASAAVTEMSGVLSLVRLSDDEEPESDAEAKSGVDGALGAVTSAGAPVVNVMVDVEVSAVVLLPA